MRREEILNKIIKESLDKIMADRFGRYSKYVIQQRALPDVRDGLKPVQRRILYAMHELGLFNDKPYKKSARVVGDVIGKYHPHGDTSVYEAMVNMSQWWKMNIRLLDMHGNVGSIDNDPAAAMRYTEVRLSKVANYILGDLKKNTVDFAPNFDDSEKEPTILPSIFPNLLVNGATGIAIGMATEMPPHNLEEIIDASVLLLNKPNASFEDLSKIVKGPDFPTGGIIYGNAGVLEALEYGKLQKEKIKLFAKYNIEQNSKNKYINITQIPYGVVKSQLVYDIEMILANSDIDGIVDVKDQSDREGIKICIILEKNANEQSILNFLFSKTNLQINYSYNSVAIDNNSPKLMNLKSLLNSYLEHVKDIKTKTLVYDLERNKLRLELVLGFLKVAQITSKVIEVIRKSTGSKSGVIQDLIKAFDFTLNQATAIAELRLYKLSKTDKDLYLKEKEELEKEISRIELLLSDPKQFRSFLINLLLDLKQQFPSPRKTKISTKNFDFNYDEKDLIKDENITVAISRQGYIKRLSEKIITSNNFEEYVLKEGDYLTFYNQVNTLDTFLIFTNLGNYAFIPIYKINESKWKDLGTHLTEFVDLKQDEEVVSVIEISDWDVNDYIVIATKNGQIKKTPIKDFEVTRLVKTYTAINLSEDDLVVNACLSNSMKDVIFVTAKGLCTKYSENDVNIYGTKAKGNKGLYLSNGDYVTCFTTALFNDVLTLITSDGHIKKIRAKDILYVPKTNKGKELFKNTSKKPYKVIEIYPTRDTDVLIVRDKDSKTFFEPIKQYTFSKADDTFNKIKIQNFDVAVIRKTQKSSKENHEKDLKDGQKKESELFNENNKKLDMLYMDVEQLMNKINKKLMSDKDEDKK
ncbi:DNA topoisomerase IV subunit A [Mycoplasmopsis ciconiae]|uniref:DNA topoisomerase (ATP-hydrolyzing) n=1 Tax=Mycoplasmopsis ciconiae TaxID=561067 RepID=A0ABU7MLG7_9BACT|nr:DNA topoisomerase IV subunit A [Mycoplasmopsis ciconiae]